MMHTVAIDIGGHNISMETGKMAKQTNGSVMVSNGDTKVLVTVVAETEPRGMGFLPLTIEYQERMYAAGRIPGSYFRREIGRPSEKEVLTCRLIDRPLRPLFPEGYDCETQLIATVFSADQNFDPDVLAMNGASAALLISDIPFGGPVGAARVGYVDGQYVLNPSKKQLERSQLNLVVAGTKTNVVMVEGKASELSEDIVLEGIFFAHAGIQPLIELQLELQRRAGKSKRVVVAPQVNAVLKEQVETLAASGMEEVLSIAEKVARSDRYSQLKAEVLAQLDPELYESVGQVHEILDDFRKRMMRSRIVTKGERLDRRSFEEVRPISCEVGILPRAHGSALFTRGETQALVICTLGSERDEQHLEGLGGDVFRRFMLHYNFPPFCVGEVRPLRGPSRRDIGHGTLARRGVEAVLPANDAFPYTLRVVSEVLESNGSSSMATVCGSSLALMDAGVPVRTPVSGVAMGLIKEGDQVVVLTDIIGDEDHLGDMDFKVVGTSDGITGLQMDIKIDGVDRQIMSQALTQAKNGRIHILEKMEEALSSPRATVSEHAPKYITMKIDPDKIRDIIGPGGKIIREMTAEFDSKIDVEDDGTVKIFSNNVETANALVKRIQQITAVPEVGKIYEGEVRTIKEFGAFVQILPGTDGMVHISELANERVKNVTDVVKEGDIIKVKVLEIDNRGRIRLSRKAVLAEDNE
ncbi:polyribonucleotide nucleotidyltransferase [Desulfobulbus oligotrophicus]|jgi:polyribonucleotide nucleotidyltransferase|uniref:Polyribonucleotide nucleotidyltransferase n=1 Tax=Desulfobulbus oligotrophicus TaxID=1909699 RepID=A0A7T5VCS5_9BACT|nr:polyribonucleotide nucleotidyltransferase [Desulfobulbus oligotrophicus]MDY0389673.1 polyribonucleotide nucleotidyltransferase [Desulfobulbus oligotrophicus]QQG65504.1 polyribonucleotide nucleotidyltransferase [Desulfobulbus oligotrophicus]